MKINLNYSITNQQNGENNILYTISIPYKDFETWATEFRKGKTIPGFRDSAIHIFSIEEEWKNQYANALKDDLIKLNNLTNTKHFSYVFEDFNNYSKIILCEIILFQEPKIEDLNFESLTKFSTSTTDKDVQNFIQAWLMENRMPNEDVFDEPIKMFDFVTLKAHDGQIFDIQVGNPEVLKEISDQLLGKQMNQTITHQFVDYETNMQSEIILTIVNIKNSKNSTIEDLAKVLNVNNEAEAKAAIKNNLNKNAEEISNELFAINIKQQILQQKFEPAIALVRRKYHFLHNLELTKLNYMDNFDNHEKIKEFLNQKKIDIKAFNQNLYLASYNLLKIYQFFDYFAKQNGIEVKNEEVEEKMKSYDLSEAKINEEHIFENIYFELLEKRIFELIFKKEFKVQEISYEDLIKKYEELTKKGEN